jgi:hypothetical protein
MNALENPTQTDWLQIVRSEFEEIPGLLLTKQQAQRLWGLNAVTCEILLSELIGSHFLKRTSSGMYARADSGQ